MKYDEMKKEFIPEFDLDYFHAYWMDIADPRETYRLKRV